MAAWELNLWYSIETPSQACGSFYKSPYLFLNWMISFLNHCKEWLKYRNTDIQTYRHFTFPWFKQHLFVEFVAKINFPLMENGCIKLLSKLFDQPMLVICITWCHVQKCCIVLKVLDSAPWTIWIFPTSCITFIHVCKNNNTRDWNEINCFQSILNLTIYVSTLYHDGISWL
jgi:hypothetical protein